MMHRAIDKKFASRIYFLLTFLYIVAWIYAKIPGIIVLTILVVLVQWKYLIVFKVPKIEKHRNDSRVNDIIPELSAIIVNADFHVDVTEMRAVRAYYKKTYKSIKATDQYNKFTKALQKKYTTSTIDVVEELSMELRMLLSEDEKYDIIKMMFEIAIVDGNLCQIELSLLKTMCYCLKITDEEFHSLQLKYTLRSYYIMLNVSPSSSDDEISESFQKLVEQHHPDNMEHSTEVDLKAVQEKLHAIRIAYDAICKEKGI